MASALLEELKILTTEAERSQKEDAVGSSWAALGAEEDPRGGVGAGVLDSENNGRIRWQPSLIVRLS